MTAIFSHLEPRYLLENVAKVCSKFSSLLLDEAYWKIRIFKQWPSKFPPVTPSLPLNWLEIAIEREEMVKRYGRKGNSKLQSIVVSNTHYAACDSILMLPIPDRYLAVSGSRDRSLVLWDVKGSKSTKDAPWSRVLCKNTNGHNVSKIVFLIITIMA